MVTVNCGDLKDKTLLVRSSKTDQEGLGETLYVCSQTRRLVNRYKKKAGIERGALFRKVRRGDNIQSNQPTARSARYIIKRQASNAGVEGFISGHSLRVGSAVSLAQAGASVVDMQVAGRRGALLFLLSSPLLRGVGVLRKGGRGRHQKNKTGLTEKCKPFMMVRD